MSTEDAPSPPRGIVQSGLVEVTCAAGCGAGDRVPAIEDKAKGTLRPVAVSPWVCLGCWLAGWRPIGPLDDGAWKVTHPDGRERAA